MIILRKSIFSLVELGSSKIVCLIAEITPTEVRVLGFSSHPSQGIRNGVISDYPKALSAISFTIDSTEKKFGKTIEEVYVLISGGDIKSESINLELALNGREVTERDLKSAQSKMMESLDHEEERTVLHSVINGYAIDGLFVSNPLGMYANRLDLSANFISVLKITLININQVFANCHLNIKSYLLSPFMDSFSCLSEDDKSIGSSVINLGAHNSSVITFKNGSLLSCYSVPIGGENITHDIAYAFGNSLMNAERLKILEGNLNYMDERDRITLEPKASEEDYEENFVTRGDLNAVILARQEELLETLMKITNLTSERKILITGGASQLPGIENVVGEFTKCRIIKKVGGFIVPKIINEFMDFKLGDSANSSIIGAITYFEALFRKEGEMYNSFKRKEKRGFAKLLNWIGK